MSVRVFLVLYILSKVQQRLPTKHCYIVYSKWIVTTGTISKYIGCFLALEMQHRKTLMFSQRLVDSNPSTRTLSNTPECWTAHRHC